MSVVAPTPPGPKLFYAVLTDVDLSGLARAGDSAAVAELYRRHHPATVRSAGRYATHAHSAEDLAAEAFTSTLLAWQRGRGPLTNIAAYLAAAARNAAFSHHRRGLHSAAAMSTEPDLLEHNAPTALSALDEMLAQEAAQLIDQIMAQLQPRWREVLTLTILGELSDHEVGEQLGLTAPAVRALRYRARRAFAEAHANATDDQHEPRSRLHATNLSHGPHTPRR